MDNQLDMDNEQLIFEIKMFRREKREYFKKKYGDITESEMLLKLNRSQSHKFRTRQKELISKILEDFFR